MGWMMRLVLDIRRYLGERQPPFIRVMHAVILVLVLWQIVSSNFISLPAARAGSWSHFGTGLLLVPLTLIFIAAEFKRWGVFHFYAFLRGEFKQIRADLKTLAARRLPEGETGGLPAIVQGFGLAALAATLSAGLAWFVLWRAGSAAAGSLMEIHAALTGLVEAYLVGHGAMGALHIALWMRGSRRQAVPSKPA